jgi:hypothetical protein
MQKKENPAKSVLHYSSDPIRSDPVTFLDVIRGTMGVVLAIGAGFLAVLFLIMTGYSLISQEPVANRPFVAACCLFAALLFASAMLTLFSGGMRALGFRRDRDQ